eukprot:6200216-Alexandrium_andersonii.AAC.1
MSASLVGSEMCIRDSCCPRRPMRCSRHHAAGTMATANEQLPIPAIAWGQQWPTRAVPRRARGA